MKLLKILAVAAALAANPMSMAAAPAAPAAAAPAASPAAHLKAVTDMVAAMQAEKMMRSIAGASRYASDAQREATFNKLGKVPPAQIHARLARMVAPLVSTETATEMARYYASPFGQKALQQKYNSGASFNFGGAPQPPKKMIDSKDKKRPAFIKAMKEFEAAEEPIRRQGFQLLQQIVK